MKETAECTVMSPGARMPRRATNRAVGYDLFALGDVVLRPNQGFTTVPVGLGIAGPKDTLALIAPRSGNALKHGIQFGEGVVDPGYRGEIMVAMRTTNQASATLSKDKAIAQLIFIPVSLPEILRTDKLKQHEVADEEWVRHG